MAQANRQALSDFVSRWQARGYEKGETVKFWEELQTALGYPHAYTTTYEDHLDNGGFVDVWLRDGSTIVEQKSLGIDLDKPEPRQGKMKTPLEQALDYVDELSPIDQPRYVVTCNFGTFRVYDRNRCSRSQLANNAFEFSLEDVAAHPEYLGFITDPVNTRLEKEKEVSLTAGAKVGELYRRLRACYRDPDSPESMHALNVLCVRIVFCLFCEDSDLFEHDAFYSYLNAYQANHVRIALRRLFRALDTPVEGRDPYDDEMRAFPYVNGGLFHGEVEIPQFDEETKRFLLEDLSADVDWSDISPTIFGGIFESTLNPETRRSGGMHYTSPENIHKVIDPLFLDGLKAEYTDIRNAEGTTPRRRKALYRRLHQKISSMRFLDPACGSGNFLTETYLSLRKLEDAILRELNDGQSALGFADDEERGNRVSLSQFYGIEINDFAVTVAEAALWISRLKANGDDSMFYDGDADDFPLTEAANIVCGNALRMDWNDVLPAEECTYIMGNPPFVGYSNVSDNQKSDRSNLFGKSGGTLDYVACWYKKASAYMLGLNVKAAFVSTNSICQGQQVEPLWKPLFNKGLHIDFAWRTFVWNSEATDQAHVHVIVVGFSYGSVGRRLLFDGDTVQEVDDINGYLSPASNVFVSSRNTPICDVSPIVYGNKPADGGHLFLTVDERDELLAADPSAEKFVRQIYGAREYINRVPRYCLWLPGVTEEELAKHPLVASRVQDVRIFRLSSTKKQTRDGASRPNEFMEIRQPNSDYVIVPCHSSERRKYVPFGFVSKDILVNNAVTMVPNATLYEFGVLTSQFHNAWMRVVAGRLKSDYRYSNKIVYNTFVWPAGISDVLRSTIEHCAQAVLDARDAHPDDSLATLYDPDKMPDDLRQAHLELDSAVEAAYGVDFNGDEEKIVAHLFKLYAAATKK